MVAPSSPEEHRRLDRSPTETRVAVREGEILNLYFKVQRGELQLGEFIHMLAGREVGAEDNAIRDQLTHVYNRGYVRTALSREVAAVNKVGDVPGVEAGVLFVDADHFKSVNDLEKDGHAAGDRTLIELAKIMGEVAGETCVVARYGGEEFVVLVPHCDQEKLEEIGQLLGEKAKQELAARAKLQRPEVTLSVGATLIHKGDTLDAVIGRADALMYKAKVGGRNRMIVDGRDTPVVFERV
jgi:diguanylate cyclase